MYDIILNYILKIKDMIYEIRGKQVMLASDLVSLYEVETKSVLKFLKYKIMKC